MEDDYHSCQETFFRSVANCFPPKSIQWNVRNLKLCQIVMLASELLFTEICCYVLSDNLCFQSDSFLVIRIGGWLAFSSLLVTVALYFLNEKLSESSSISPRADHLQYVHHVNFHTCKSKQKAFYFADFVHSATCAAFFIVISMVLLDEITNSCGNGLEICYKFLSFLLSLTLCLLFSKSSLLIKDEYVDGQRTNEIRASSLATYTNTLGSSENNEREKLLPKPENDQYATL